MPATYEPIASQTLGSDAATVEFTSISGNYTDLRLVMSVRSSHNATDYVGLILNGVNTQTFSSTYLFGSGSSATSGRYSSTSSFNNLFSSNLYVENSTTTWTLITVDLMSYANTNVFKTGLAAVAAPGLQVQRHVSLWQSTNAVTSIKADLYYGDLKSGSTFSLYGIKAA